MVVIGICAALPGFSPRPGLRLPRGSGVCMCLIYVCFTTLRVFGVAGHRRSPGRSLEVLVDLGSEIGGSRVKRHV